MDKNKKEVDGENRASLPCPTCGNDNMDLLIWDDPKDAELVVCVVCGTRYNLVSGDFDQPFSRPSSGSLGL